jgi:hypothetical protein
MHKLSNHIFLLYLKVKPIKKLKLGDFMLSVK